MFRSINLITHNLSIFDGFLFAYACWQMFNGQTAHINTASARKKDSTDEVIGFDNIGAVEYIYCALLSAYGAANWYFLHQINANSTGAVSVLTLVWSILSIAVTVLAAVQFYHLKSGAIVELKKRVVQ